MRKASHDARQSEQSRTEATSDKSWRTPGKALSRLSGREKGVPQAMKIKGQIKSVGYTLDGGTTITIETKYPFEPIISESGKELAITFKDWKSNRTLDQNALLWTIIGAIDEKQNGRRSEDGSVELYKQIIKRARVKAVFIQTLEDARSTLEKTFRVVVDRGDRTNENGVEMKVFECYLGSSQFDTKEMSDTIETALDYAEQAGVDARHFREDWKGINIGE